MRQRDVGRLAGLPTLPGVYISNANRRVIYVGKAIVRNRVRSYFQDGANHTARPSAWLPISPTSSGSSPPPERGTDPENS